MVVGTCCGKLVLVRFSRAGPNIEFQLSATAAAVTCIDFYTIDTGVTHMIIGREDGLVEVFELLEVDDSILSPTLIYSKVKCTNIIVADLFVTKVGSRMRISTTCSKLNSPLNYFFTFILRMDNRTCRRVLQ